MSYFKKFTDFCAGLGAFLCALHLIRKYMSFTPYTETEEPIGSLEKLKQFLANGTEADYSLLASLTLLLIVSVAVGRIFARLPYFCFAISLLPVLPLAYIFDTAHFVPLRAILTVLVALHVIGNVAESALRDKEDGRHRLWICAKLSTGAGLLLSFFLIWMLKHPLPELNDGLSGFELDLYSNFTELDLKIMSTLFWMYAVLLVLSLILYNVYFVDAIVALVPAVYATHAMVSENLGVASTVFFAVAIVCAATHICLMLMENNLSRKEQQALKQ